jgi:hypothetical protein
MNRLWHKAHRMPIRPTLAQRVKWHLAHAKACGCRELPANITAELKRQRIRPPASRRALRARR